MRLTQALKDFPKKRFCKKILIVRQKFLRPFFEKKRTFFFDQKLKKISKKSFFSNFYNFLSTWSFFMRPKYGHFFFLRIVANLKVSDNWATAASFYPILTLKGYIFQKLPEGLKKVEVEVGQLHFVCFQVSWSQIIFYWENASGKQTKWSWATSTSTVLETSSNFWKK